MQAFAWIGLGLILSLQAMAVSKTGIRGQRYCEILYSKNIKDYHVWTTFGLNHCPAQQWRTITASKIRHETGAWLVHLNGPRYWTIDGFEHTSLRHPDIKIMAGLAFREAAVVHVGWAALWKRLHPYETQKVRRETTWVYDAHQRVYELISPEGRVFVMQSYSLQKYPQSLHSLATLGQHLHLPQGWQFKTGLLSQRQTVNAVNQEALIVQDDFLNTYQWSEHDLLVE